ncbi:Rieske (2Fe-2S) protein [Halobaculum sp. EA56]|uniref:Rieske (2Fe-2S) protein n=1 Tax=Halobaculum sp. EA56 TaxID=3421648 RepID=UPI003EBFF036
MSTNDPADGGVGDDFTRVAAADEIPEGRGIGVSVDGIEVAVFNAGDEFFAISNRCAHQGAPLCKAGEAKINADDTWTGTRGGVDVEENTVACPWHLWSWDLETGEHEPSGKRIGTFDCAVEDGDVFVRI